MSGREPTTARLVALALAGALVGGVILVVRSGHAVPDQVQPIAWNHQACAHCGMLIGEPRHAAQLVTDDGDVESFDDPGCALRRLADHPAVHRLWFHHARDDRWLAADAVGFVTGATTPMASGLAAVDRGTPGALDLAAALAAIRRETAPTGAAP